MFYQGRVLEQGEFSTVSQTKAYRDLLYRRDDRDSSSSTGLYSIGTEKVAVPPWAEDASQSEYMQVRRGKGNK